jgi:hypothetical protein
MPVGLVMSPTRLPAISSGRSLTSTSIPGSTLAARSISDVRASGSEAPSATTSTGVAAEVDVAGAGVTAGTGVAPEMGLSMGEWLGGSGDDSGAGAEAGEASPQATSTAAARAPANRRCSSLNADSSRAESEKRNSPAYRGCVGLATMWPHYSKAAVR